jgi:antitoxin PrlF
MSKIESEQQQVVNVSKRGQATIPKEFRDELGIEAPGRVKFVRTEEGDIVVKPIQSLTDLRGILSEKTDEDGKTATQILHEERERDKQKDQEMMDRLNIETDEVDGE